MGRTPRDRRKAFWGGILAEHLATLILRLKGYRILAHRFAIREGEIDLVARRGDTLAFIEVKVRPTIDEARLAIDAGKRRRDFARGPQLACHSSMGCVIDLARRCRSCRPLALATP